LLWLVMLLLPFVTSEQLLRYKADGDAKWYDPSSLSKFAHF
jgi:hypothetical protein